MRTMDYQSGEKQLIKSSGDDGDLRPIAHRLGMQKIKWSSRTVRSTTSTVEGQGDKDAPLHSLDTLRVFMAKVEKQIQGRMDEEK